MFCIFWIPMAVGAVAGLAKHLIDKGEESGQRRVAQARAEGSWITGKDYQLPDRPNLIGNVMEGASMGANAGSAWDKMAAAQAQKEGASFVSDLKEDLDATPDRSAKIADDYGEFKTAMAEMPKASSLQSLTIPEESAFQEPMHRSLASPGGQKPLHQMDNISELINQYKAKQPAPVVPQAVPAGPNGQPMPQPQLKPAQPMSFWEQMNPYGTRRSYS